MQRGYNLDLIISSTKYSDMEPWKNDMPSSMTYYQHKWDKLITGNINLTMQVESFIKQFRNN